MFGITDIEGQNALDNLDIPASVREQLIGGEKVRQQLLYDFRPEEKQRAADLNKDRISLL